MIQSVRVRWQQKSGWPVSRPVQSGSVCFDAHDAVNSSESLGHLATRSHESAFIAAFRLGLNPMERHLCVKAMPHRPMQWAENMSKTGTIPLDAEEFCIP
jgi:hypothetical protein